MAVIVRYNVWDYSHTEKPMLEESDKRVQLRFNFNFGQFSGNKLHIQLKEMEIIHSAS